MKLGEAGETEGARNSDQEEWQILWEHSRKPCAIRTVMLARSAIPDRIKRLTLTQEVGTILTTTSPSVPWERKAELVSDLSLRMKMSGYSERRRESTINSGLSAWRRIKEDVKQGMRPLYRDRKWRREERNSEKERKRSRWYKRLGG